MLGLCTAEEHIVWMQCTEYRLLNAVHWIIQSACELLLHMEGLFTSLDGEKEMSKWADVASPADAWESSLKSQYFDIQQLKFTYCLSMCGWILQGALTWTLLSMSIWNWLPFNANISDVDWDKILSAFSSEVLCCAVMTASSTKIKNNSPTQKGLDRICTSKQPRLDSCGLQTVLF